MSNVIHLNQNTIGELDQVSVQVSEYSEANGGSDKGCYYAVEVLFTDDTWCVVCFESDHHTAIKRAEEEASVRGAVVLSESCWPNRKVKGGAA